MCLSKRPDSLPAVSVRVTSTSPEERPAGVRTLQEPLASVVVVSVLPSGQVTFREALRSGMFP